MTRTTLTEATTLNAAPGISGRMAVQIINPGWGSSGYYSSEVLEAAADDRVFPAGTHMYLDHPSETDKYDRPERSVKDLAAILTEDAQWTGDALVAPVQVFGPYRDVVAEMKDAIGVSIRAAAEVTEGGQAEGRTGPIIDRIVESASIDFVTAAGRGGRILDVLESARAKPVQRAVRRGVSEATANETREQLQTALVDAYGAEKTWIWVRDFDDDLVWFQVETPDDLGTWQQAYTLGDDGAVLSGDRVEVRAETKYVPVGAPTSNVPVTTSSTSAEATSPAHVPPVIPAGQSTHTHESQGGTDMAEIEEARLRQLEADAGRVTTLESERDQARTELATERARTAATTRARQRVTEANGDLAPATVDRIVTAATATVPLTEAGALDEAAFDTATDTARTAEETYLAGLAEANGTGVVNGFGRSTGGQGVSESDFDALDDATFGPITQEA